MNNRKLLEIETDRLILSEVTINDLENIHKLHLMPEVDEFNTMGIPKTINETEEFLQPVIEAQDAIPRASYMWKVVLKNTNEFIGVAGYSLSNNKFKLGEIYYKLDPAYWGNGYATELAKRLVVLGFEYFNLHKVEAGVATKNVKSIRVLEKIGMTREGLRRKILPIRGEWIDNYHYAILEDDKRNY
ncbi:GNAT family protein [Draconibacterium sp. IB214405]|uniref:GNAT family N-acetyltransferase n=1 Tax=Draconibacterium sp. IB214405 TaxID=3097352 RepID=UPI002A0E5F6F|nr:GNAT family protein [Draconibacterium sp. IB214405]MDX8337924.1 GNAT family protein [Draconibacterium sp. IB214405]